MLDAEAAWNTRDPDRVAGAYSLDSEWRNRDTFLWGRNEIRDFLARKWARELDYALRKDLWAFHGNRLAVRFRYESLDQSGQWWRSYGNENWEFDDHGLMRRREASINDVAITASERRIFGAREDSDTAGVPLHQRPPMGMDRRFQVELLPDVDWSELRRRVIHSEELGLDLATTADQYVDWKNPTVPWFDLWTTLAALAEATTTIRLAPCVAQIPMRDPATFARQVLTVDHVSGGRVEAALGLGLTVDPGYDIIGVPNWDNRERADRFGEYIQVVDELLSSARCSFSSDYYTVDSAAVHESVQSPRPPITIAAMGPRMMRYAATHADTWNTMSFGAGADVLLSDATALKAKMARTCNAVGRDPETLRHSFLLFDGEARAQGGRLFYWDSAAAADVMPRLR